MSRRGLATFTVVLLLAACGGGGREGPGPGEEIGGSGGLVAPGGDGGAGGTGGVVNPGGAGGEEPAGPRIEAIEPESGPPGTMLLLRGVRLEARRELVILFGGGASSHAHSVDPDDTWIRTVVPEEAATGPVRVLLDGASVSGPTFTLTDGYPVPHVERITPAAVTIGAPDTKVRLKGWGFRAGSQVLLDDVEFAPSAVTTTGLEVVVPRAHLATEANRQLRVVNPAPGGGASEPVSFRVAPTINLLRATPLDAFSLELVFDRPPSRAAVTDKENFHFECFT